MRLVPFVAFVCVAGCYSQPGAGQGLPPDVLAFARESVAMLQAPEFEQLVQRLAPRPVPPGPRAEFERLDATKAVPPSGAVSDVPQGENRGGGAAVPLPTAAPRLEVAHTSLKPASGATSDRDPAGGTVPTAQRNQPWCLAARMICGTPRQPGVREAPHNMPSSAVPGTHGGNPAPGTRATSPPWHSYEGCASVYLEFRE